jgi:hypothetical protein
VEVGGAFQPVEHGGSAAAAVVGRPYRHERCAVLPGGDVGSGVLLALGGLFRRLNVSTQPVHGVLETVHGRDGRHSVAFDEGGLSLVLRYRVADGSGHHEGNARPVPRYAESRLREQCIQSEAAAHSPCEGFAIRAVVPAVRVIVGVRVFDLGSLEGLDVAGFQVAHAFVDQTAGRGEFLLVVEVDRQRAFLLVFRVGAQLVDPHPLATQKP